MSILGYDSPDTDECLGLLLARDIHHMTQREAAHSVTRAFQTKVFSFQEMSDRLGVVIWVLKQDHRVTPMYLNQAYIYAKRLIESQDYLDAFIPPVMRYHSLAAEIALLRENISHSGIYN